MAVSRDGDVFSVADSEGLKPEEILDFSGNISPVPVPERIRQAAQESLHCLERYPDPLARRLRSRAAELFGVSPEEVCAGNGTGEFIYAIPRALRPRRAVILAPSGHDYWRACDYMGAEAEGILASENHEFIPDLSQFEMRLSGTDIVFIGNPNNPTGVAVPADHLRTLAGRFPSVTFVVDESFGQFVPESAGKSLLVGARPKNVIVLRTPSPLFGLPGLMIGFLIASPETCTTINQAREPWTLGALSQCLAERVLDESGDAAGLREAVIAERERVRDELSSLPGVRVFKSETNFLLLKLTRPGLTSSTVCERLLKQKVLIRNASGFRGLDGKFVRISIRTAGDNTRLVAALKATLDDSKWK